MIYDSLTAVSRRPEDASNSPSGFSVHLAGHEGFDTAPWLTPEFKDVRFPSREAGVELAGWYVGSPSGGAAVVLVHGLGDSRRRHSVLLPAGMLARAGFAVLIMDVREHGDSQVVDGRTALGNEEYLDVLGGWDWLVSRGHAEDCVGLFGASLGAAVVLIAMAEEPRVPAAFVDSPFSDTRTIIREELAREGYPAFLASGGTLMARLVGGIDLLEHAPEDCAAKLGRSALFLTHGLADSRIGAHHGKRLAALAAERGPGIETWFVPDADHLEAMLVMPGEYARRLCGFFRGVLGAAGAGVKEKRQLQRTLRP
jgi:dipeptidyl aminopeptidase/acylaminoacyl peptidase